MLVLPSREVHQSSHHDPAVARGLFLVLVLPMLLVPGCTSEPPPNVFSDTLLIEPGSYFEINLGMRDGGDIQVLIEASRTVSWDLHSHSGGQVHIHVQGNGTQVSTDFTAPAAGTYSVLIEHEQEAPVEVHLGIQGEAVVASTAP